MPKADLLSLFVRPLNQLGFPEPEFYRPGLEEISVEALRPSRGDLNVIHLESSTSVVARGFMM